MEENATMMSAAEKVAALQALQGSSGWAILVEILNDNKKYLEEAILSAVDPETRTEMTEKEIEQARHKRGLTIELIDTPQKLIDEIKRSEKVEIVNFDPYEIAKQEKE
jgi:hypothetical protein